MIASIPPTGELAFSEPRVHRRGNRRGRHMTTLLLAQVPPRQPDMARCRGSTRMKTHRTARPYRARNNDLKVVMRLQGPVATTGAERLNQAAHRERWPAPLPPPTFCSST